MSGLANLRELLKDTRVWSAAGRVAVFDGDSKHYFKNSEGYYVISVLLLHHESPIRANWLFPPGFHRLPDVNDEVVVLFDHGDFEGEAYCLAGAWGGTPIPDGETGEFAPNQVIVLGDRLETRLDTKVLIKAPTVVVDSAQARIGGATGTQKTLMATSFLSALDTLIAAIAAAMGTITSGAPAGGAPAGTAITTALNIFTNAVTRAAYQTQNTQVK